MQIKFNLRKKHTKKAKINANKELNLQNKYLTYYLHWVFVY
jgi:hypothetical protein